MSEWIPVADTAEFVQKDRKLIDRGGTMQIGLFHVKGEYFAVSAWCSHQRATMFHGEVDGYELECPLHGARFDLRTGKQTCLPAVRGVARYEVKVDGTQIFIRVSP